MPFHVAGVSSLSPLLNSLATNSSSECSAVTFLTNSVRPISIKLKRDNGFRFLSPTRCSKRADKRDSIGLRRKIEVHGVDIDSCTPGQYDLLLCPKCQGGRSMQRSLSFHISENWNLAMWRCFNVQCGWAGQVLADVEKPNLDNNSRGKFISLRPLTEETLGLEVLGDELLEYFAERKISKETLRRNNVMQVRGGQKIIAFTYRQNGVLVGCKYRTVRKRFWQESGTEKMLYGLDDISESDEIIIVEGEVDKLSLEEAGYYNCVSVPAGAPQTISTKEPPILEKDVSFQYLWNCRDYLDKVSRIILATDNDTPGQALAEELARRLGRDRCWKVDWPKKDEFSFFKDANEVLQTMGADALREAVGKAKLY